MLWRILMMPLWILKKGLGAVFMAVRLTLGLLRFVFGRRLIALAVLVGGFFLGKKFLKDKVESEPKPQ
jgi:hypothetical protein